MNKILFLFLILISCKNQEANPIENPISEIAFGKELFENKGNCASCHLPDQKVIGPSIKEIASIYKNQNASIVDFLKNDAKPIIDPSQYEIMKTNFEITKTMTDNELFALEQYILSH